MTLQDGVIDEGPIEEPDAGLETVQPVLELFSGSVQALWATTYNIDLRLFNEFLLARLGDPPLNVAVLTDHTRLAAGLSRIPLEHVDALNAVNRRWLLRSVQPGHQAFHPKTYLALSSKEATLFVGSGNLSTGGLNDGHEVFTTFCSGTVVGDAAISIWRDWMRQLVEFIGDLTMAARFQDLEERLPSPEAAAPVVAPLLHNLNASIAEQLIEVVREAGGKVEELLLTAPFYDANAEAVGVLLNELEPGRVCLFLGGATQVRGDQLVDRLVDSGAEVGVFGYEPTEFVHAKLVGVVSGDRGWLLSGSANLSQAALTHSAQEHGNIELAVLAQLTPGEVRSAFVPAGMSVAERDLDALRELTFESEPETTLSSLCRLVSARALPDGRIEVSSVPPADPSWLLEDLTERQSLIIDSSGVVLTEGPLPGRLVQLVDPAGEVVSNRAVVDDPEALAAILLAPTERGRTGGPPPGLTQGDLSRPLGRLLRWLHENLPMDVSERAGGGSGGSDGQHDPSNDDLWDRLEREQLARDPRAHIYARIWRRTAKAAAGAEPIIALLEQLRDRLPAEQTPRGSPLRLLIKPPDPVPSGTPTHKWSPSTRIRVRTRNLLLRWARAQTDHHLVWVNPLAPAGNLAIMAWAFACLRIEVIRDPTQIELTEEDLDGLWRAWLKPFVGTGGNDGFIDRLDDATRIEVYAKLPEWLPETVAALCWLEVRHGVNHRERVVDFQAVLKAAFNHNLVNPTDDAAQYLTEITGHSVTREDIDRDLLEATYFIDDDLWCKRTAQELGLVTLRLEAPIGPFVRLDVDGITDPLLDPRVPQLICDTRDYRRRDEVTLFATDRWRLSFSPGERLTYLPSLNRPELLSDMAVAADDLNALAGTGGVLAELFPGIQLVA